MTEKTLSDLDDETRGRIHGILDAVIHLTEKAAYHDDHLTDDRSEKSRRHHTACRNTCTNMAADLHRDAIEIAMNADTTDDQ